MPSISIVAYLTLFAAVGFLFLFAALLLGWFLRAKAPSAEKLRAYECGEPPVGSGFVQFDLRFYVVALVFIIFEVELAFFFPWATVFGKATQAMCTVESPVGAQAPAAEVDARGTAAPLDATSFNRLPFGQSDARRLAAAAMIDMVIFFGILLVGFAYVWWRGDLDWVRAMGSRP